MKTILIPIDFSAASDNAVRYASGLSASPEYGIGRVILLHSYHVTLSEQILPTPDLVQLTESEIAEKRKQVKEKMDLLSNEMFSDAKNKGIIVEPVCSSLPLLRAILEEVEANNSDLLIIGSNSQEIPDESYLGEQVIRIAKTSPVPVLVVPANGIFTGLKRVLMAFDFKTLTNLNVLKTLKESHQWIKQELMVLNVDPGLKRAAPDEKFLEVSEGLNQWLKDIPHTVHFSDDRDILQGILTFAAENEVDLVIALPGKHSFLYSLTHKSMTEALSVDAQLPVLILK